jgi:hypothetical protein
MASRQYESLPAVGGIGTYCRQVELGDNITVQDVIDARDDVAAREILLQRGEQGAAGHVVGAHTRLHALTNEHSAAVYPVAGPPGLQQALLPVHDKLDQVMGQLQMLQLRVEQNEARAANRHVMIPHQLLTPLPILNAPLGPANFPATRADLRGMTRHACVQLLTAYGQPVQGLNAQPGHDVERLAQDRLASFIGLVWTP